MLANTDLTKIKKVALNFLMLEPEPTDMPPIIKHPFTNYSCVHLDIADAHYELIDIMKDRNALDRWRKHYADMIDNAKSSRHIYMMLTKSYRFAFLKYAMPYFSQKDFSEYLADAWVLCESPNSDPNFTKQQLVGLFKKADAKILMDEDEYENFLNLDEIITVYRGVTEYNSKNIKALSWTLDRDKAEWFAHRFGENGTVYEAQISKEHILAYFSARNESEVIVEPKYLMEITEAQDISEGFTMTM